MTKTTGKHIKQPNATSDFREFKVIEVFGYKALTLIDPVFLGLIRKALSNKAHVSANLQERGEKENGIANQDL